RRPGHPGRDGRGGHVLLQVGGTRRNDGRGAAPGPPPFRRSVVRAVTLRRLPAAALAAAAVLRPVGPGVGPPAPVGAEARVLRLLRVLPGVRVLLLRRVRLPLLRCVGLPLLRGLRVGAVALPLRPATALRRALRSAALPAVPHRCLLR